MGLLAEERVNLDIYEELKRVCDILNISSEKELKEAIKLGSIRKTEEGKNIYEDLSKEGYTVYRSLKEDRMEYGIYKKNTRDTIFRYDAIEDMSGNFLSSSERKIDFDDRMEELFGN